MIWIWQQEIWPGFDRVGADSPQLCSSARERTRAFRLSAQQLQGNLEAMSARDRLDGLVGLMLSEALSSYAIEGQRLTREPLRGALQRLLAGHADTPKTPDVTDERAVAAAELMVDVRSHWDQPLDEALLGRWQTLALPERRTSLRLRGTYRNDTAPMRLLSGTGADIKVHYEAPPAAKVPDEMARFIDWYNSTRPRLIDNDETLPGLLRAGTAHLWFELIHPFEDGNGRVGRALVDHALSQTLGYPSLACFSTAVLKTRQRYYLELQNSGMGSTSLNVPAWMAYFTDSIDHAETLAKEKIDLVLERARFYDAHGARLNTRQQALIDHVFTQRIDDTECGVTTRAYRALTGCSRATAYRDISNMCRQGMLSAARGRGRNTSYRVEQIMPSSLHDLLPPKIRATPVAEA